MSYSIVYWRHVSTLEGERRSGSHKALQSGAEEQNNFRPRPGVQAAPRGSSVAVLRRRQHTPCRERHLERTYLTPSAFPSLSTIYRSTINEAMARLQRDQKTPLN
ncbi:hypothetical protein FA13DRAFT_1734794 [Coprinellus micaceus]|uniref:Uncharacterized protein n=1 Tax=Coprinellus micaceus TaxID=71717 RepID=A0A4Y7T4P4_COPMI|nr:hypothetical protein FA13DRAFT_1734794 [Coprinellus micaceus]